MPASNKPNKNQLDDGVTYSEESSVTVVEEGSEGTPAEDMLSSSNDNNKTVVMGPSQNGTKSFLIGKKVIYGSVWVQGSFMNRQTMAMFIDHGGFSEASDPKSADYVVWTGGEDINPEMYKEKPIPGTYWTTKRDIEYVNVYSKEINPDAVKIGVCRGAQLLCVLNGGKLWQDVDKHNGGLHDVKDVASGETFKINSLHHQQMRLPDHSKVRCDVLAYTRLSTYKDSYECHWSEATNGYDLKEIDVEAAWFPNTLCLCFQAHPEFNHKNTREYFFDLVDRISFSHQLAS